MLQKIISKKRRSLSGHVKTQEHTIVCSTESEVLKQLSGYRADPADEEPIPPNFVLELFDPARPTQVVSLHTPAGITDNVTIHTLH